MPTRSLIRWYLLLFLGLSRLSVFAQAPAVFPDLDRYVTGAMQQWQIPGLALAIVKDGKVVYAKGYGVRETGKADAVDEHTIFAVGSNTKAFTATALGLLADEKKLSLDDKVTRYLPQFRLYDTLATREITLRDLLCHRIGLGTWHGDLVAWGSTYSRDELMDKMHFIRPANSFRGGFGYCNTAFLVAGQVIPQVTPHSWDSFVQERLLKPLRMTRTSTSVKDLNGRANVATPHTYSEGKVIRIPYRDIDNIGPAGSMNSTVTDMANWLIMQLNEGTFDNTTVVPASVIRQTHTPQTIIPAVPYGNPGYPSKHFQAYGLGWFLEDYQGRMHISHSGGVDGMISEAAFLPEEKLGLVILTNYDNHSFTRALKYQILDRYLGVNPEKNWHQELLAWTEQSKKREEEIQKRLLTSRNGKSRAGFVINQLAGTYQHPHYGTAVISLQNNQLTIRLSAHPEISGRLEYWQEDNFMCYWNDPAFGKGLIPFTANATGTVTGFTLLVRPEFIDPVEYTFSRVPQ
jgi:CubicO group peptidase (beta-lactamase class C family)